MSQIYEDFKEYRDQHGLSSIHHRDRPDVVTQNGALFTMEYLLCLILNKAPELESEIERLKGVYASLEHSPGLSMRFPISPEVDSMDNLGAILLFSKLFDNSSFAKRMRDHGLNVECEDIDDSDVRNVKFSLICAIVSTFQLAGFFKAKNFWNVSAPTHFNLEGWFGRSPGFMGWLDIAATRVTNTFRAFGLFVGQMLSVRAEKGNIDAWKLPYLIWWDLKDRGRIWRWGFNYWQKKLYEMYPGGMQEVYSIAYQDPNHPIRKYSPRCFKS